MSNLSDIGNLMYLYLDEIDPGNGTDAPKFLITAAAKALNQYGDRNWVPVIVKEIGEDRYQVIGNTFIYAVAEEAGLEKIWCIIADEREETEKLTQVLSGEVTPKINLSQATRDEIKDALQYLIEKPGSLLKGVNLLTATNRIDAAPRQYWKTLDPITKLKCGITKGKLKALEEVFDLIPQPMPDVIKDPAILKSLTTTELKALAKQRQLTGYSKKKKQELVELLST
ncbi:rho termination factor, N-terminal domain protein [Lyngbya aestuarii BL J]|uniref:Rho termination factor, N-terminal domain protein n=1 Tax=Lyngbya aestuarii BL J TaxID=1348334 RepID=U7Q8T2_9CYAN|nr:Rho termination factor N-terminal domain-containing protein [Lyngbya aestuarii]ERT04203.1 rho termination factor, N-terminal domain protein [Lyngbya aestuarii BL J]